MHTVSKTSPGLVRALGPLTATAVVVGTIIGSGVFKKPATIAAAVPDLSWALLVWVLLGVLALLGALALAEVAVLYPKAGGNYVFLREGYGRLAGFLWGWVEFLDIRSASIAALATIFTESLHDVLKQTVNQGSPLLNSWGEVVLTVAVIAILALVNIRGVEWGGVLQLLITLVKVGSLLGIILLPLLLWGRAEGGTAEPAREPRPIALTGFISALLAALWAYHGWMNIGPVAEEVRRPQRNIPLALLAGVGIVMFLYVGANVAYALVVPWERMATISGNTSVVVVFSETLLGPVGATVAAAVVMCSVFGALNGNILVGPRLLYAMGADGLAPRALHEVHPTFRTPAKAIAVLAAWSCLLVVGVAILKETDVLEKEKSAFDSLTDFAMFGAVIFETLAVTTIFVFRRTRPDAERLYRCWGYPVVPLLYLILPILILGNMFVSQRVEAAIGVGFILTGVLVYYGGGLNRRLGESAT
jgi:basic amino acid/polyamine antiporter, APA family